MAKCNACGKYMSTTEAVNCPKCKKSSHKACVNIPSGAQVNPSWICPECKAKAPKFGDQSTPVRGIGASYCVEFSDMDQNIISEKTDGGINDLLVEEIRRFREEMHDTMEEFRSFRQDMAELRAKVGSIESRLDRVESSIQALESERRHPKDEITKLEQVIDRLKADLNDRDRETLLADIDITGIPEESGENVTHLVTSCAVKLGIKLDERDIVSCTRVGGLRSVAGGGTGGTGDDGGRTRPRPIAVRLARRTLRDQLVHAARVRRHTTTEGIGLRTEPTQFYINERLTKSDRQLFYKARETARRSGWRFVWTKQAMIFVRRAQGDSACRIRTDADIDKVFGHDAVRS